MATKAITDAEILNKVGNTPLVKLDSSSKDNPTYS